jgi:formylglycine-generating enzyme required for sulfatase activity
LEAVEVLAHGTTNPWGLYDVAGGTSEWTEEIFFSTGLPYDRLFEGTAWVTGSGSSLADSITRAAGGSPPSSFGYLFGFRVAAVVPGPGGVMFLVMSGVVFGTRRNR